MKLVEPGLDDRDRILWCPVVSEEVVYGISRGLKLPILVRPCCIVHGGTNELGAQSPFSTLYMLAVLFASVWFLSGHTAVSFTGVNVLGAQLSLRNAAIDSVVTISDSGDR